MPTSRAPKQPVPATVIRLPAVTLPGEPMSRMHPPLADRGAPIEAGATGAADEVPASGAPLEAGATGEAGAARTGARTDGAGGQAPGAGGLPAGAPLPTGTGFRAMVLGR